MRVCTHDNFIVLSHYEIRPAAPSADFPTHFPSHYHDAELTSPCHILVMPRVRLGSEKYQFNMSLVWHDWELNSRSPRRKACALPIQPQQLVCLQRGDCQSFAPDQRRTTILPPPAKCCSWEYASITDLHAYQLVAVYIYCTSLRQLLHAVS